jgi:hypothetical protein
MLSTCGTLDGFAHESSRSEGVDIRTLDAGATLVVTTRRSSYRIVVLDGIRQVVLIEGGVFPEATAVQLAGATAGGSALKIGWILVGLRAEFRLGSRRITCGAVESFSVEDFSMESRDKQVA